MPEHRSKPAARQRLPHPALQKLWLPADTCSGFLILCGILRFSQRKVYSGAVRIFRIKLDGFCVRLERFFEVTFFLPCDSGAPVGGAKSGFSARALSQSASASSYLPQQA